MPGSSRTGTAGSSAIAKRDTGSWCGAADRRARCSSTSFKSEPAAASTMSSTSTRASGAASCRERDRRSRSEEHTSELQSLMRISYAVFCLKKKNKQQISVQAVNEFATYTIRTSYMKYMDPTVISYIG